MTDPSRWQKDRPIGLPDVGADVDAELEFHREALIQDLIREGWSPKDARGEAARRLAALPGVRRELVAIDGRRQRKDRRAEHFGELRSDIRFALRGLKSHPGFAAMAILALGLGIGATATILSAAHSILVRSLPYPDADRLVSIYAQLKEKDWHGINISYGDFQSWQSQNRTFSAMGIWTWSTLTLSGTTEPERIATADVSANLFPLLGLNPILGRHFTPEDEKPNGPRILLLGYGLWQRRYGGDPAIVGRSITCEGQPCTVVGVMPQGFAFPDRGQAWRPFVPYPGDELHNNRGYAGAIGRLAAGVDLDQAKADLAVVSKRLQEEFPRENRGWEAEPISLRQDLVGDLRRPLQIFLGAAALVLLIVCANVANLMLARGADRRRELAVRIAIGAGRRRLIRQLVTESLVLSALGGALGLVLVVGGLRLFRLAFPDDLPFYIRLGVDGTALLLTAGVSILTGVLFGTAPALRNTAVDLTGALKDGARGGDGVERSRFRRMLVVTELALSFALLVGAGLLIKSYRRLTGTDLGFQEQGILSARISLPFSQYPGPRAALFFEQLLQRLRTVPGVESVGSAQGLPFSGWDVQGEFMIEGRPARRAGDELVSHFQWITPGFFPTIGVPVIAGRNLRETDRDSANPVVVINEKLAHEFAGTDPIGKRIRGGDDNSGSPWLTIVGVIRDYRHYRLPQPMGPAIYLPYYSQPGLTQGVVIRTKLADPHQLEAGLRRALKELDPTVPVYGVQTFEEVASRSLWRQRLQGQTLGIFAALALVLATVGIYGVISYSVAQRTRELGVRIALGATARDVHGLVLGQGLRLAGAGLGIGLLLSIVAGRILRSLVDGVEASDPILFAGVLGALLFTALLASYLPARRAATVDPLMAIRAE